MFSPPKADIIEISNSLNDDFSSKLDQLSVKESVIVTVILRTTTAAASAN